jgi:hypothetical protein
MESRQQLVVRSRLDRQGRLCIAPQSSAIGLANIPGVFAVNDPWDAILI